MMNTARMRLWILPILTVMLVISVALNVGLAYRVRDFVSLQKVQVAKLEALRLHRGTRVPPLKATRVDRVDRAFETILYDAVPHATVLYVLSPTCGWCAKNQRSIETLISQKRTAYRFIAISLIEQGAAEYAALHRLDVPLYTGLSEDAKHAYRMSATPQTIVVSSGGVVLASWNGAYAGERKESIEKFFGVRLPDIERGG